MERLEELGGGSKTGARVTSMAFWTTTEGLLYAHIPSKMIGLHVGSGSFFRRTRCCEPCGSPIDEQLQGRMATKVPVVELHLKDMSVYFEDV